MKTLKELNEEIAAKSKRLGAIFKEAGPEMDLSKVESIEGDPHQKAAEIQRLNTELKSLQDERKPLAAVVEAKEANDLRMQEYSQPATSLPTPSGKGRTVDPDRVEKTLEQRIAESEGFKFWQDGGVKAAAGKVLADLSPAEVKTIITLATISPQTQRLPNLVDMALEERTIADLMLESGMTVPTLEYYEETTWTNAAAPVAEGGIKPESAWAVTLRSETARKIPHWIPLTDEAMADNAALEGQIRGRMVFGVRRAEETQLLSGSGVAPQLTGILNRTGIQTQAKGTDATPTAVYNAITKVRNTGFAEPTAIVMHPNDWAAIVTLQGADGTYVFGHPAAPVVDRLWGLPVRQTTAITENTALVGAFRPYAQVFRRTGITVSISTEHSTYFVENKVALLAEERIALAVYRPAAFCTVTGI